MHCGMFTSDSERQALYFSQAKQVENEDLKVELEETKFEVDRIARQSTSEKMFNESEIRDLKNKYNYEY